MVELDDDPAVSLAGDGLILWGTLVGGGYAVGAMRTAGWFTLSPIAEIGYWSIILVIGWVGSVVLGMRARRHHHSTLPPAALATMIALPGGITFTLYFMFALGAGTFDPFTMWAVAAAQFGAWLFGLGALVRRGWLTLCGCGWFVLFAVGTVLGQENPWLEVLMTLGCGVLLTGPGIILLRHEAKFLEPNQTKETGRKFSNENT
jgi:hypothetical protein